MKSTRYESIDLLTRSAILVALYCSNLLSAETTIPPPSETPAHVIVSGRTSTFTDAKIVAVGQQIPKTYSGTRVKNTEGFSWYVSQHYAFKTDFKEDRAKFYLSLLEMAYPHYVEFFGKEPPGIEEKRMAVCYASSKEQLKKALDSDGIKWNFDGGGITFEGYRCGYQFPSGSLDYHLRYILIHECAHLFQMCLTGTCGNTPKWFTEGVADSISNHVYDSEKRQLTLNVTDKPTTNNYFDGPIDRVRAGTLNVEEALKGLKRDSNFLLVQYLITDPERLQRFRLFRDELFFNNENIPAERANSIVFPKFFGPLEEVNAGLKRWCNTHHNSFHYAEWGWEQDKDTLWSYGFAKDGKLSATDAYLNLNEKPAYDALRMDYPLQAVPEWIGTSERGIDEPSIAALVDFSKNPKRGVAGLGLGVIRDPKEKEGLLKVLIEAERSLVIDGTALEGQVSKTPLPDALIAAGAANAHRFGIHIKVLKDVLQVSVRAKAGDKVEEAVVNYPLTAAQRERVLSKPLSILARDGRHGVTPYMDDRRKAEPELTRPAPPNRWRYAGDHALDALYRTCWKLGAQTPAELTALRDTLIEAAGKDSAAQEEALAKYKTALDSILKVVNASSLEPGIKESLAKALQTAIPQP